MFYLFLFDFYFDILTFDLDWRAFPACDCYIHSVLINTILQHLFTAVLQSSKLFIAATLATKDAQITGRLKAKHCVVFEHHSNASHH